MNLNARFKKTEFKKKRRKIKHCSRLKKTFSNRKNHCTFFLIKKKRKFRIKFKSYNGENI